MKRRWTVLAFSCAIGALLVLATGCAQTSGGESARASASAQSTTSADVSAASAASSGDSFVVVADPTSSSQSSSAQSQAIDWESSAFAKTFAKDIDPIVKDSGMDMGVCTVDLTKGDRAAINGNKRMVAASMIKLIIAASFLEQVENKSFSLDDTYVLKEGDIVGGTGSLGGRGAGAQTTYGEALDMMISESDNTAANILIEALGMDAVNDTAKRLGLKETELNRLMMDEEAIAAGTENYTSAIDVATLLELAYEGKLVSAQASKTLLSALAGQTDDDGLLAGLPDGVSFAHKTGTLANAKHDGGIATVSDGDDFVLVALCSGEGFSAQGALDAMADVARASYELIEGSASSSE